MKLVSSHIDLKDGRITLDGRDVFADLLVPARLEEAARHQESFTRSLPDEDTSAGHVMPAAIVTLSGSS